MDEQAKLEEKLQMLTSAAKFLKNQIETTTLNEYERPILEKCLLIMQFN
jgi:hypothetical protein